MPHLDARPADRPFQTPSTKVSGDWSAHIATMLDSVAALLESLAPEQWDAPSMCEGWTVRHVAGHIVWRLGESSGELVASGLRQVLRARFDADRVIDDLARRTALAPPEELVERIRLLAERRVQGIGRTGITELTEAVVHGYDISEGLGLPLRVSPRSSAAVASARLKLPLGSARRIAAGRTLRAVDARWQIGSGPALDATAAQIVLALHGRRVALPRA